MLFSIVYMLLLSACINISLSSPLNHDLASTKILRRGGTPIIDNLSFRRHRRRGEPETNDDDPGMLPSATPHPNNLEKVETAFQDAIALTFSVTGFIDDDDDIFPHYFSPNDRAEIKRIFGTIYNNGNGSEFLNNILVQTQDIDQLCNSQTLAYSGDHNTNKPFIVLCPNAFKKKAVGQLPGKEPTDPDGMNFYAECTQHGGDIGDYVSYHFNTLGFTLLHEYMHMDEMIQSSFGSIIDNPNNVPGYGPVNVYDKLAKNLARINADSYAYYAAQVFWTTKCLQGFKAPRAGIDDDDPDCAGEVCQP